MSLSSLRRLPGELAGLYWDSGVVNDVPALAWFLMSSLVPLALGTTALATVLLRDYARAQALAARISQVLPKDVHNQVVELLLRTKHDSPAIVVGSICGMVWVSSGIVGVIERCLTRLLALSRVGLIRGKVRNLALAAGVTTLIVLMVLVASAATGVWRRLGLNPLLFRVGVTMISLVVTMIVCGLVYRVLGGRTVRGRAVLAGGLVSAVILLATPTAVGYYLRYAAGTTPVELFLMLAGVLVTCCLASFGLLLGAAVTARVELGERLQHRCAASASACQPAKPRSYPGAIEPHKETP